MALLIQPLPWRVVEGRVIDTNDFSVVHGVTPDEAEFIVKACNHHDELVAALKATADRYCSLVASGDCGNWDPEEEPHIIAARAVLAKVKDQ